MRHMLLEIDCYAQLLNELRITYNISKNQD